MLIHELQFGLYLNQYEICNQRNMITYKNETNFKLTILDTHLHIINVPFIKSYCTIYYVIRACFTSTLILRYGILDQSCPMQDRLHFFCILDKSQTTNLEKISTESSTMLGGSYTLIFVFLFLESDLPGSYSGFIDTSNGWRMFSKIYILPSGDLLRFRIGFILHCLEHVEFFVNCFVYIVCHFL